VVLLDIRLPDRDGVAVTGEILRAHPEAAVLLVTMLDSAELVLRGLRAGARGYVLKSSDAPAIVSALRTVAEGGLVLGPGVSSPLSGSGPPAPCPAPFDRLSRREREVAAEVAKGGTNLQIARRLGISEKTVRNLVSSVLAATGTPHRIALALLAQERGLVARGRHPPDRGVPP
jgi:two-component system, NarL family, nitrate/nitrite response regulator NarL